MKREIEEYLKLFKKLHSLCHIGKGDSYEAMILIEEISSIYRDLDDNDVALIQFWSREISATTIHSLAKRLDHESGGNID